MPRKYSDIPKKCRMCIDFGRVNKTIIVEKFSLQRFDEKISRFAWKDKIFHSHRYIKWTSSNSTWRKIYGWHFVFNREGTISMESSSIQFEFHFFNPLNDSPNSFSEMMQITFAGFPSVDLNFELNWLHFSFLTHFQSN